LAGIAGYQDVTGTVLLLRSWDQVLSVSFFMPAYRMAAALTRSAFSPGSACAAPWWCQKCRRRNVKYAVVPGSRITAGS